MNNKIIKTIVRLSDICDYFSFVELKYLCPNVTDAEIEAVICYLEKENYIRKRITPNVKNRRYNFIKDACPIQLDL